MVRLVKQVALTLNAHFPGRLAALWLVDAPPVVQWPLKALRKLLHPATGQKIQMCGAKDACLPFSLAPIPAAVAVASAGAPVTDGEEVDDLALGSDEEVNFWYV